MSVEKLARWYRRVAPVARRVFLESEGTEGREIVQSWDVNDSIEPIGFGSAAWDLAVERTDDEDRAMRFCARAEDSEGRTIGQTVLRVVPSGANAPSDVREDATRDGMVAQLMRHNEYLLQANLKMMAEQIKSMGAMGTMYREALDRIAKRNARLEAAEDATASEAAQQAAEIDAAIKMKTFELLEKFAPMVASKLLEPKH